MPSVIEVSRGHLIESRHRVSAAVVREDGATLATTGNPDLVAFWRSCAKPFQAVPMIVRGADRAFAITDEQLALACASHNGEPRHVELARRMLAQAGASETDLVCGPHSSISDDVARAMVSRGEKPTKAHNNCSGKHAGMIALARHQQWGSAGYEQPTHLVQQDCLEEVARWSGASASQQSDATDGCGVPTFALSLRAMALAWARLGAAGDGRPVPGCSAASSAAAGRLFNAMRAHPFFVAGTGRLDTDLIEGSARRIVAKVGAEGVYCAAIPELGLGVALKVEDGASRCLNPALIGLLDLLAPGITPALQAYRDQPITNTLGATVGRVAARMELDRAALA
jgi:L-asparaginase II